MSEHWITRDISGEAYEALRADGWKTMDWKEANTNTMATFQESLTPLGLVLVVGEGYGDDQWWFKVETETDVATRDVDCGHCKALCREPCREPSGRKAAKAHFRRLQDRFDTSGPRAAMTTPE